MGAKKGIDWDSPAVRPLLGAVSDAEVAQRLGVVESTVWDARRRRGIPPWRGQGRPAHPRGGRKPAPLPPHPGYTEGSSGPRRLCGNRYHSRRTALPRLLPDTPEYFPRNLTAGGREISRSECHVCYRARQASMYQARKSRQRQELHAAAHDLSSALD